MVIWSAEALQDLEGVKEAISAGSPDAAARVAEELEQFPRSGRVVPEWENTAARELVQAPYRILYRLLNDTDVEVIAVLHGARNLKP